MAETKQFVVIGLGSFGGALATRLSQNSCRVTGMDSNKESVEALKDVLYEAVIGDARDRDSIAHLPVDSAHAVFISMGEDITQSLLATLHAKELGARQVIVKGVTQEHARILKCLGVDRVIFPETEIARQLADRMTWPNVIDFLPIDPEYSFLEIAMPDTYSGKTLQDLDLRKKFNIWVVGVKDALSGKLEMFPGGQYTLSADQVLLVVGKQEDVSKIASMT
ncbi:Ktr system potassium uptake protein A [Pseudobythopirellula maris]|uniref:Ktr system potassium uptake protein A n=1 Tax=Pseudobythopirellula maris TaxID=2527991 RepID=A0A5C5ZPL5_9BACT|nr:TrkA family potassium uptake protein [Pseudobythopirellula maris]TWT88323.1 Ktr system potassium uptake protein A [Pseudobythopirellula maris]